MAKLTTNLIGKRVVPTLYDKTFHERNDEGRPIWIDDPTRPTGGWPEGFKANAAGEFLAEIAAAWTEDGRVKLALVDPFGNTGETFLICVRLGANQGV